MHTIFTGSIESIIMRQTTDLLEWKELRGLIWQAASAGVSEACIEDWMHHVTDVPGHVTEARELREWITDEIKEMTCC